MRKSILKWTDHHIGAGQWTTAIVALIALGFAIWIGFVQNSVNDKLTSIESSTEIFGYLAYNGPTPVFLRITNVGKLQMYLSSYSINNSEVATSIPDALIPAGQQQNAWYDIRLPENATSTEFSLNLTDQLGSMWMSRIMVRHTEQGWSVYTYKLQSDQDRSKK